MAKQLPEWAKGLKLDWRVGRADDKITIRKRGILAMMTQLTEGSFRIEFLDPTMDDFLSLGTEATAQKAEGYLIKIIEKHLTLFAGILLGGAVAGEPGGV